MYLKEPSTISPALLTVLMLLGLIAISAPSYGSGSEGLIDTSPSSGGLAIAASSNSLYSASNNASNSISYNSSTITSREEKSISYAPTEIGVGTGYYSSQPVSFGSELGHSTQIRNTRTGTSIKRDLDYADAVSGGIEIAAEDSSYRSDDLEWRSTATTHMSVDEDVTDGQIHIGVLQGSSADQGKVSSGLDSMTTAWKDPEIEIDEDYVGTYHIEKDMTIEVPYRQVKHVSDWLSCCSTLFEINSLRRVHVSADDVFNCNLVRSS